MKGIWLAYSLLAHVVHPAWPYCDDPSPAFPIPNLDVHDEELSAVEEVVIRTIREVALDERFNATSFSLEVTSSKKSLFALHHTANVRSKRYPGTEKVDGNSLYRIASMTKPFTVLAILQQHAAGTLLLDDTVDRYVPVLTDRQNGTIAWHKITIRALASQISGLPRDLAPAGFAEQPEIAKSFGLPPVTLESLPQCDGVVDYNRSCSAEDLLEWIKKIRPLFQPSQKSSYSNMNYDLLSLVIENVTNVSYTEYIQTRILDLLDMRSSTFETPQESSMVIPADIEYFWNLEVGISKATGGLYSSTNDLSKFLRYALTHYNAITPAVNWFQPTSWSNVMQAFYGMPWEIFRANDLIPQSTRPITLITKSGGVPGYASIMVMVPEYGFGVSILVAGDDKLLALIRDIIVPAMVKYADEIAQKTLAKRYAGTYIASDESGMNSTISLAHDREHGLLLQRLVSNGTDSLSSLVTFLTDGQKSTDDILFYVVPTLLYQDEAKQRGERWRILLIPHSRKSKAFNTAPWDRFCPADFDLLSYGGLPVNEIIFWGGREDTAEPVEQAELTGFRIVLYRSSLQPAMTDIFESEL